MIDFLPLNLNVDGTPLTIYVSKDAAKDANGVRFSVSFTDTLKYAKDNDALPFTTKISDLVYLHADQQLNPCPRMISTTYAAQTEHSKNVDKQITSAGIVSDPGKDWVLDNLLISGNSCNYGWHVKTNANDWKGIKVHPTQITGIKVIQPISTFHVGHTHKDYSQCLRMVKRDCIINGNKDDLLSVIQVNTLLSYTKINYDVISLLGIV